MKRNSGDKNTFLLYKDWKPLIDACTSEQAGDILKGIYAYVCEGEAPEFDEPLLAGFFEMISRAIDENDSAWAEKREKAKKAIQARWEKKQAEAAEDQQEKPEEAEQKPERDGEATETIPDKPDHNGEVTEKATPEQPAEYPEPQPAPKPKKEPEKKKTKAAPASPRISARTIFNACLLAYPISPELQETMEAWLKYKTERRESYKEQGLRALMKKASESEKEYGIKAVVEVVEESMANRYAGIVWDRLRGRASPGGGRTAKRNQFNEFEQNEYDFDALEKELSG